MRNHINRSSNRYRINTLSAAISVALLPLAAPVVHAQSADEPQLEEVVVTGSRITRFEGDYTAPVLSLGADRIEQSGNVNIEDFVSEVGALVGSSGSFQTQRDDGGAQAGVNALNMRNLGNNRTLTLVNGRRHVSAIATGEPLVDTNTIPVALIERVDVLTGGASAVYGADAVSGAVNFILKDDFEGLAIRTQGGMSDQGDAEDFFASFTFGTNFAEDRGNVTASYEYRKQERLEIFERDYALKKRQYLQNNPAEYRQTDDPNVPDRILTPPGARTFTYTAPSGRYDILGYDPSTGEELTYPSPIALNAAGTPFDTGTPISGFAQLYGDGTPTAYFSSSLIPELEVHSFNVLGHYDINDYATAFGEFKFVQSNAVNPQSSSYTTVLELSLDNPFIPASFNNVLAGIQDPSINLARDDLEMRSLNDNTRETTRFVFGVRGDLTDWLRYEASFNHGVTDVTARLDNQRLEDRYFAALDAVIDPATGQATCRSNLDPSAVPPNDSVVSPWNPDVWGDPANMTFTPGPDSGCVPFNPFISGEQYFLTPGRINPADPNGAAQAFITNAGVPLVSEGQAKQTVVNAFVSGDTTGVGFELPGGPIDFVLGYEYRKEQVADTPDSLRSNPNGLTPFDFVRPSGSSYDVNEVFGEVSAPIFQDLAPLLQGLRLDGAYRYSDWSTIGQTTAYSLGLNWTLSDSLIIRGSHGESVRAPNLVELFEPDNQASFRPDDPCEAANLGFQTPNTVANCTAELTALGLDPTGFVSASPVGRPGLRGGNPNLEEETSVTSTVGFVYTPQWAPGLVTAIDWWEIDMSQGVLYPSDDEIVERCYDQPSLNNQYCSLFSRATTGSLIGIIVDLEQRPVNVSTLYTSGVDFSASYPLDMNDFGTLTLALNGTWLDSLKTQPTVDPGQIEEVGLDDTLLGEQAPEWVGNLSASWMRGPLSVTYRYRYQSELQRYRDDEIARQPDIAYPIKISSLDVHDIQASYSFSSGWEGYIGVNNLTEQEPDPSYLNLPVGPRGRVFYMGISADFADLNSFNPFR
ncbi:MAG: TonB-dependent receptor [Gammaproteobacteria bacterium]|nr:TonB-dependent receptor [Pseudomonadales bacterium]MCP5347421.1 TonB-dependent receptor [Pseudomonadales bacterium]